MNMFEETSYGGAKKQMNTGQVVCRLGQPLHSLLSPVSFLGSKLIGLEAYFYSGCNCLGMLLSLSFGRVPSTETEKYTRVNLNYFALP